MPIPGPVTIEVYNSVDGAAFFRRLLREWQEAGALVKSHSAISENDYRRRRGRLGRMILRWRMYVGFAWICFWATRRRRTGAPLRVVTTNPFFAPALVRRLVGERGATINLLYDLFPEALIRAGTIRPGSWIAGRCAAVTRTAFRECAATVFLGEQLRAYAEATYGPVRRAVVIPVGADGVPFRQSPPQRLPDGTRPTILYAGLMGSMHDTATIAAVWEKELPAEVIWSFRASGTGYDRLRAARAQPPAVNWGGALADADWQRAMKGAQVALVTIAPGAERVVMPSKTYSALVAGQAILAICCRASDLAELVFRHECGWVVEPDDAAGLRAALQEIACEPAGLWEKRQRAFAAGHRYYDMTPIAAEWTRLFGTLSASTSGLPPGDLHA